MSAGQGCRRCGHDRHNHSSQHEGRCMVMRVSGPASDHKVIVSAEDYSTPDSELHPGRTVQRCGCEGFLR